MFDPLWNPQVVRGLKGLKFAAGEVFKLKRALPD
jgi:hypothetical protein